jgi:hypothetical protein
MYEYDHLHGNTKSLQSWIWITYCGKKMKASLDCFLFSIDAIELVFLKEKHAYLHGLVKW